VDTAEDKVNLPSIALIVIGVLNILFWLAWSGYAIFVIIVGGGLNVFLNLSALMVDEMVFGALVGMLWGPLVQSCTCGVNIGMALGSLLLIAAGIKLRSLSDKGIVFLGVAAGVIGPLLSMVLGVLASVATLSCCGLVFGQLPTLIVLLINAGIGAWALVVMSDDDVSDAFEANSQ